MIENKIKVEINDTDEKEVINDGVYQSPDSDVVLDKEYIDALNDMMKGL